MIKLVLPSFMLLVACSHNDLPPPKPAAEVGVLTLKTQSLSLTTDLPGRTAAFRVAEVRPQVNGVILKRLFVEGSQVKAGQQLYQIDPAPFEASLESAQASLARAEATAKSSLLLAQRYKPLSEAHAVSLQDYANAIAAQDQAAADVALAKASVNTARINLAYTRVFAPISGRTGRSSVTEGALVAANQVSALVTVQQLDPIYVDVTQASITLLRLRRELAEGSLKQSGAQAEARLILEDGTPYAEPGTLQFTEVTVDPTSGSVTLRALFPNPHNILLPGMFVRARLQEGLKDQAILIPQRAVTHNARGESTVLLVGSDNKPVVRVVHTDRAIADQWLISEGVVAGDKVVVIGLQSAQPGVEARVHEATQVELSGSPTPATPPHS